MPSSQTRGRLPVDLLTKTFSLVENLPELRPCVLSLTYYAYYFIYLMHVFVIFTSLKRLYLISCSFAVCCETCYGFIFPFRAM